MEALNRVWNKKIGGFPKAIYLFLKILLLRIVEKINSYFWSLNLKKCGANVSIQLGTSIRYPGNITIGSKVSIGRDCLIFTEFHDSKLSISSGSQINRNSSIDFSGDLIIEGNVLISEGVNIMTHDHGYDPFSKPKKRKLIIEENAWIGAHAIILPQVEIIGANSVIASGAIVTKNVEAGAIVGGNPAKLIKSK